MKKFYTALFFVLTMPLLISFRCFAYDNVDAADISNKLNSYFNCNLTYDTAFTSYINSHFSYNGYLVFRYYPAGNSITVYAKADTNPSVYNDRIVFPDCIYMSNNGGNGYSYSSNTFYFNDSSVLLFSNGEEMYDFFHVNIDYDNPIFSSAISVPEMTVTFVGVGLSFPSNVNGVYVDCIVPQEDAFYIQLQAKYSVADLVQINLNNGVISYEYLDWTDGESFDIYGLQDNMSSVHVTASEFQTSWNTVISNLLEIASFPQFTSNVPFWVQNPTAQKYVDAQNRYKNVLMRQAPLYGSRMELFARYYAIVDNSVYVGKWIHWNSANPSNTEQLGNSYQEDQPFPGYQNTSSDNNLPDKEDTYTNFGENTSVDNNPYSQVIINNNVPNYPDYPTAVSYNHDNILVQFISTAKQLPSFFGDVGTFLTSSFAFIPSEIWMLVGFGFMCSIVVMIIKVL